MTPPIEPDFPRSPLDRFFLTATIYGEARGEPLLGQVAVAWVIRNRAARLTLTIPEVVLAAFQFECWEGSASVGPTCSMMLAWIRDPATWKVCEMVADAVLAGDSPDESGGADHYLNVVLTRARFGKLPTWAADPADSQRANARLVTRVIGGHTFLNLALKLA